MILHEPAAGTASTVRPCVAKARILPVEADVGATIAPEAVSMSAVVPGTVSVSATPLGAGLDPPIG